MLCAIRNSLRAPLASVGRLFHTTPAQATEKFDHKRIPQDDEGVQGEKLVDLDSVLKAYVNKHVYVLFVGIYSFIISKNMFFFFSKQNLFPTLESDDLLFDGTPYKHLPVCNIRVSHNNTIFTLTDAAGVVKLLKSCGVEGFKNTKKGTNIAAQTTAISLAMVCYCNFYLLLI